MDKSLLNKPEGSFETTVPRRFPVSSSDHGPRTNQSSPPHSQAEVASSIDTPTCSSCNADSCNTGSCAHEVVRDLLPVIDNLDRAILTGRHSGDFDEFMSSIEVVRNQLFDTLTQHGLREIPGTWCPFDTCHHVAVGQEDDDGHPHGSVVDVVEQGYRFGERVLRPSKVIVSRNDSSNPGEFE
ncbi:MAG: nucleotide exchange factor GrpE [Rhodopirellula sp. JB044]|uniref:nucleotide exchange factor GrpE n=1 Tax=Rhodopirellula sp. JB044 TaxID=3342844 RepID=UPI00370B965B